MRLVDRLRDRYRMGSTFWDGEASGAAVLMQSYGQTAREQTVTNLLSQAQQAYGSNPVVWSVIFHRMMLFTEALFCFQDLNTKKLQIGDPSLKLLRRPWPNGSTGDLLARMEQDSSLAGNAFIWNAGNQLVRLPPGEVTIVSELVDDTYRRVIGFDWEPTPTFNGDRSDRAQLFPVDEVCHWAPVPDPNANFRGMSWLTPVIQEVTGDQQLAAHKIQYLTNSATPNLLIKYAARLRPDTIDAVVERVQAKYGGANAYKTLVLDQGADATVIGSNLGDMGFDALQSASAKRIASAGGVPVDLIGLGTGAENFQTSMRRMADLTMRSQWRTACAALETIVPPLDGDRLWYDVSDVPALRQSETERAQVSQVKAAAVLTLVQGGFTKDSAVDAVTSDDLSLLKEDPNAVTKPAPGTPEAAAGGPSGSNGSSSNGNGTKVPQEPQVGPRSPRPQTPASKAPMPSTFVRPASVNANGHG